MKRYLKWSFRVLLILMSIVLMGGIAIYYQGEQERQQLVIDFPAPGEMVTVDGKAMHLYCTGDPERSPTVILEAGAGDFSLVWSKVQPMLAEHTRVCSYDRAGFGWSQRPLGVARSSEQMVTELYALIDAANLQGPFILVGHSLGGLNVRLFAKQYPELVQGIVLLDAVNEQQGEYQPLFAKQSQLALADYQIVSWLHRTNLMALSPESIPHPGFEEPQLSQYRAVFASRGHIYAMMDEMVSLPESLEKARQQQLMSLKVPMVVIASTQAQADPALSAQENQQLTKAWLTMQRQLGEQTQVQQFIELPEVGHYIQLQQPTLVVDAVKRLLSLKMK